MPSWKKAKVEFKFTEMSCSDILIFSFTFCGQKYLSDRIWTGKAAYFSPYSPVFILIYYSIKQYHSWYWITLIFWAGWLEQDGPPKVPSNHNHSVFLWFCDSVIWPAVNIPNAIQNTTGLCHKIYCWLMVTSLATRPFSERTAFHPVVSQYVLVPGVTPPQVQDLSFPHTECHDFPLGSFLQSVKVPSNGGTTNSFHFCTIQKLANSTVSLFRSIVKTLNRICPSFEVRLYLLFNEWQSTKQMKQHGEI